MTERIAMRYAVALLGFSEFERGALASYFRLAQQHALVFEQVAMLADADFVIADADHPHSVAEVMEASRMQDAIFIGLRAPAGATAWLRRPIEPTRIRRELDALVEQRLALLDEPATDWGDSFSLPTTAGDRAAKHVLVVDDSRIAQKFLQVRLQNLGYCVHLARDAAQALERLASKAFSMVFLDVALGPAGNIDGLTVCQHIKHRPEHPGGLAPKVIMVTGAATSTDRVRGEFAGCDAYLTKPLMEPEFVATLRQLDPLPA
jgi:CheY-like chemotaxis protein